jgi:hypothetical protein
MIIPKNIRNQKYLQGCKERKTLPHGLWECTLAEALWKTM